MNQTTQTLLSKQIIHKRKGKNREELKTEPTLMTFDTTGEKKSSRFCRNFSDSPSELNATRFVSWVATLTRVRSTYHDNVPDAKLRFFFQ